jgi:hypothetical protein
MSKRIKQAAVMVVVVFAAAQFVRPNRVNPVTDATRTIQAHVGTASGLAPVLDRACGDCHSNGTVWPWYTQVAPVSWVMAYAVKDGRKTINFSEWAAYPPEVQRALLSASCEAASRGRMPGGAWTLLHPEARLSARDLTTICEAAQQASLAGVAP